MTDSVRPISRRLLLQAGSLAAVGVLAEACAPGPTPQPATASPTAAPSAAQVATPAPTEASSPSPTPVPPLTGDAITTAVSGLPHGAKVTLPGGSEVPAADLFTAGTAPLPVIGGHPPDPTRNPAAALLVVLAAADRTRMTGPVDLTSVLPALTFAPVRLPLPSLPGGKATVVAASADPTGLVLRPGAALLLAGTLPDGRLAGAVADPARTVAGAPRLELVLLDPAGIAPVLAAAGATLTGSILALADGTTADLRPIDAALADRLASSAGVLFVDAVPLQPPKAKTPLLTLDPVVPAPDPADIAGFVRAAQASDGRVLARDAAGKAIGRAQFIGGQPAWDWHGPDGLDWSLRELADRIGLRFGCAPNGSSILNSARYRALDRAQFNSAALESFHWDIVSPTPSGYDFTDPDRYVRIALDDAMGVEAHHLMWSNFLPTWVTTGDFSKTELLAVSEAHIKAVVGHFAGRVGVWSVFNEPVSGPIYGATPVEHYWANRYGAEYNALVERSLRWAREADPSARLLVNDHHNAGENAEVTRGFRDLVDYLVAHDAPLDGVGLQMHLSYPEVAGFSMSAFAQVLREYRDIGMPVYVTEFDVDMTAFAGSPSDNAATQARYYRECLETALASGDLRSFTVFGLTDDTSWLTGGGNAATAPLMFRSDFTPKPAYFAVRDVLKKAAGLA